MRGWTPEQVATAAEAELVRGGEGGPVAATVDSRAIEPGELFVGIPGARVDGGAFAAQALAGGAWGALVTPERAAELAQGDEWSTGPVPGGAVLAAADPARALGRLARAWRRALGAHVVGITGSTGKTSTKDLLHALLAPHRRTSSSRANFNTEIGLPLEVLRTAPGTEVLVLEMAMRGAGQIAELTEIAEPDVGVIVNVGPVHLELLGSIEGIAAAKAELVAGLRPGATAVLPAYEPLLEPHRRDDVVTVTFGEGGDVAMAADEGERVTVEAEGEETVFEVPFRRRHLKLNLLAAVAAARAVGVRPEGRVEVEVAEGRGRRIDTAAGILVIDDCYNANPMSMQAALDDLAQSPGRTVAVLGDMLELGAEERRFHAELGTQAAAAGVDVLLAVGPLAAATAEAYGDGAQTAGDAAEAAERVRELVRPGDAVLVKASRGVGLDAVVAALV
jgi:UDP-N-acetylmuramoyl-tripeptide--D-alanyl-D-alanine ligase